MTLSPVEARPAEPRATHARAALEAALAHGRDPAVRRRWRAELVELLRLPSVSAEPRRRPAIDAAAAWLAAHLTSIGLPGARVLPNPRGGPPSVYAERPGRPRLLLYGHYDVQPAPPEAFVPRIEAGRVRARGASDDKGQLFALLKALECWLATSRGLPIGATVWLEGEEEIGSPSLDAFLERHGELLRADGLVLADATSPRAGRASIVRGLRGLLTANLRVRGPAGERHAGRYGGAVANPAEALARIVASLHDRRGRVAVAGFYDGARAADPDEPRGTAAERAALVPALTVTGMAGGYAGPGYKAAIPARAIAKLSARLVPGQAPDAVASRLRAHVRSASPAGVIVDLAIARGTGAVLLPRASWLLAAGTRAAEAAWGAPPVVARSGGTIAFVERFHRRFGAPALVFGFGSPEDNAHGPDESFALASLARGVETMVRLLGEAAA